MAFPSEFTDENADDEHNNDTQSKTPPTTSNTSPILQAKLAVLFAFALVTTVITVFGICMKRKQDFDLSRSLDRDGAKIKNEFGSSLGMTMSMLDMFASVVVSSTAQGNMTWPFIEVPMYGFQASKVLNLTPMVALHVSPLVTDSQRQLYEEWVNETSAVEGDGADQMLVSYIFEELSSQGNNQFIYLPTLLSYPTSMTAPRNWDLFSVFPDSVYSNETISISRASYSTEIGENSSLAVDSPTSIIAYPLINRMAVSEANKEAPLLGFLWGAIHWKETLSGVYTREKMVLVFSSECNPSFSFELHEGDVTFLGMGDHHNPAAAVSTETDVTAITCALQHSRSYIVFPHHNASCDFKVGIYVTQTYLDEFIDRTPLVIVFGAIVGFVVLFSLVLFYSAFIHFQQQKIVRKASRSEAIVQSLFPDSVRDRLYEDRWDDPAIKSLLTTRDVSCTEHIDDREDPIADLFPSCTVVFADFAGFTAWSSTREPTQVIILLETVFRAFDEIADRRGIFKVESVADCWLGVAGLPVTREDHALAVARFAIDLLECFKRLTKTLEMRLGPDCDSLALRVGIHSGQVTAGVLRGKVIRFQLFGDTVNVASRMESTGKPGMIQLSEQTAELLRQAGKDHWLTKRNEPVMAKGKGKLSTYWLKRHSRTNDSNHDLSDFEDEYWREVENNSEAERPTTQTSNKQHRLIRWTGGILMKNLRAMQAKVEWQLIGDDEWQAVDAFDVRPSCNKTSFDEVQEIIYLPQQEPRIAVNSIVLDADVEVQLLDFLDEVANSYRDNPFHCHSHATHVTMSVSKLLSRIRAPKVDCCSPVGEETTTEHDNTYGILDPLTQFACVFSAVVHDMDHTGVSNSQLCVEQTELAARYNNQSVAEQHSLDQAFRLLEKGRFVSLRRAIYKTKEEKRRFRQLVVNMVLATDIMDKDLKQLRDKRWDRAFSDDHEERDIEKVNRKATIVIEHIIQASDVAHTMQHWHIYRKWNQRLFQEIYKAHLEGRSSADPTEFWYKGELGFFDNYVIPLAKKLQECGVLGVSGDEYLNYAVSNRAEWAAKGRDVVAEMLESAQEKYGSNHV